MTPGKQKQSIFSKFILAVLLVILLYAILSVTVFFFASSYQLNEVAGADIRATSTNSENLTRKYVEGKINLEDYQSALATIDASWVGTITVWNGDHELLYGEDYFKAFIAENESASDTNKTQKELKYYQTNLIYIQNAGELEAIIQVTDHTLTTKYIETVFNKALFFSLIIIFSLISIIVFLASYKFENYIKKFRVVMSKVSNGNYDIEADETMPSEFGEMAYTLNTLTKNIKTNMNQLSLEKNRLNHILNSMSEGIIAFDKEGEITHINKAAFYLTGNYSEGKMNQNIVYESLKKLIDEDAILSIIRTKGIASYNISVHNEKILNISIIPLYDNEMVSGATAIIRDVTEVERLENTRREYVSNVSHELRTPLTAMRGLIEPLADGMVKSEKKKQRYYDILLRETMRLSNLINDLLQLSRLQSGSDKSPDAYFYIDELIDYIFDKYSSIAKGQGITLKKDVYEDNKIFSNENRIEQIITILLDNAIKYAGSNSTVGVKVEKKSNQVIFNVWDTGKGIDPEDIDHIFDRFFKSDRSHNSKGTGLGLAIAKEIIEQMGGSIAVKSKPGKGAEFTFIIKPVKK
ncbi:MAG: PAS domain S-box protein [Clostridia bacterium]|nr:PAS domain S-box protein [Clostridia bacterium]